MLRPPRELGSDAFKQAQSGRGLPARSVRASLMVLSQRAVPCLMWSGGHALTLYVEQGTSAGGQSPSRNLVDQEVLPETPSPSPPV